MTELFDFILSHEADFKSKARLASLYADFALLKTNNPDGYTANVLAWKDALEHGSAAGLTPGDSALILSTGDELLKALDSRVYGRPLALGAVVGDAVAQGDMIPVKEFREAKTSVYKKSWMTLPTLSDVAKWAFRQVGLAGSSGALTHGDFVVVKTVERISAAIASHVAREASSPSSLIFSLETFRHAYAHPHTILKDLPQGLQLSASDIQIILTHLSRDMQAASISKSADGRMTIKFRPAGSTAPPSPVTDADRTIAQLRSLSLSLETQITSLAAHTAHLTAEARNFVTNNQKTRALSALRQRKAAETTLARREDSLAQAQAALGAIDEAVGQVEMVSAMEASGRVLKDLNRQVGGVERVDAIMDGLREGIADTEEVGRVLGEAGSETVDESEVDEELEALEKEQKDRDERSRKLADEKRATEALKAAPEVPMAEPNSSTARSPDVEHRLSDMSLEVKPQPTQEGI